MPDRPNQERTRRGLTGRQAGFILLAWLFCAGVTARFLPRQEVAGPASSMLFAERLLLLCRMVPMSPETQSVLLQVARSMEEGETARLKVIDGQPLTDEELKSLPGGYRALADFQREPSAEAQATLRERAGAAEARLALCAAMVGVLVLLAALLSFFGGTVAERPAAPMSTMAPLGVLSVFMGWDVVTLFGVFPVLDAAGLREALTPFAFVLVVQLAVYALMLLMLRRVCRNGPWNFNLPFPTAWVGRGYFACYALVYTANLLIGVLSGRTPNSTNPLLDMFMQAAPWQVGTLAFLVIVVGPVFEELMFRGWLLGGLRERWGDGRALLVSATLFAVIHGDPWATPALFLLGCVFGRVYLRSGSLFASIILHAMWNATTFTFLLANMP